MQNRSKRPGRCCATTSRTGEPRVLHWQKAIKNETAGCLQSPCWRMKRPSRKKKKWADGVKRNWGSVLHVAFGLNAGRWAHVMLSRGRIDCGRDAFVASKTKMLNGSGPAGGRRESRAVSLLAVVGDWAFKDRSRRDDEVNQLGRPKRCSGSRHPMSQPGCRGCTRGKRYEGDGTARNRKY